MSKGVINVKKVLTHDNITDMTIKTVSNNKFRHYLDLIGL